MTLPLLQTLAPIDRGSPRGNVEAAVIARLEPLHVRSGGYLRKIDHYNGEVGVNERGMIDVQRELLGQAPAVLVIAGVSTTRERTLNRRRLVESVQIEILAVSAHRRSFDAQLLGDGSGAVLADPGIHRILHDVRSLLMVGPLGAAGARRLRHRTDAEVVPGGGAFTAWRAIYEIDVDVVETPVEIGPFNSAEHRHNLDDAEPVNPVIVAEVTIDA